MTPKDLTAINQIDPALELTLGGAALNGPEGPTVLTPWATGEAYFVVLKRSSSMS